MPPANPSLDVLIVTWNRCADLLRALESIRAQSVQPARVIVVDNGSTDGTCEKIRAEHPEVVLLAQKENLGACGGRNAGMAAVGAELVFFMDDDTELLPGCLERICERFRQNSNLGGVQPAILLPGQSPPSAQDPMIPRPNPHPISAAWCVRTSALPPHPWPGHFVRQGEEMWVAMHLYERGLESEIWPGAVCLHHQAVGGQRERVFYFFARNSFLLYLQRFPLPLGAPMALYKVFRTLLNVRTMGHLRAWAAGVGSGVSMLVSGQARRASIGWGGAMRYLKAVRAARG